MNRITLIVVVAAAVITAIIWGRRMALRKHHGSGGRFLPQDVPGPDKICRATEALLLTIAGGLVLLMTATNRSTGGMLLMLDELRTGYAQVNLIMFICAAAGLLAAVVIAFFWRTWAAVVLMTVVLCVYGLLLNGGSYPGELFVPERAIESAFEYTINISNTNVREAELWVNDVYLGKTPVTMTPDEFLAKVPYRPNPPEDYETNVVEVLEYGTRGRTKQKKKRWISLGILHRSDLYTHRRLRELTTTSWSAQKKRRMYYARVKHGNEWGWAGGRSGTSGGGSRLAYHGTSYFEVFFPERRKRLEKLLDKARLKNYRVGGEWFKAIETYNEDGWIALRKAADSEPKMMCILDAWATWRYELDKVKDGESAWRVFQRICDEANMREQYLTPSVAGRAVELLVPKLPAERLIERAEELIRTIRHYSWNSWRMNSRYQFGFSNRLGGVSLGTHNIMGGSSGGRAGFRKFPMSGFPVTHAVWMLNDLLVSRNEPQPNIIQRRIVPQLVRWRHGDGFPRIALQAAAYFGGPSIDTFLLRKYRKTRGGLNYRDKIHRHGKPINKWLYLLSYLNTPAGKQFRKDHTIRIMDMADKLYWDNFVIMLRDTNFIFADNLLAKQYWPRFTELANRRSSDYSLETKWRYLKQMSSAATPRMFVEGWKNTSAILTYDDGLNVLDELDETLRKSVAQALIEQVKKNSDNLRATSRPPISDAEIRRRFIAILQRYIGQNKQQRQAKHLFEVSQGINQEQRRRQIALWLEHTNPNSPLIAMLSNAKNPSLRIMVTGALRENPTPNNRIILTKLMKDPDAKVRTAAKKVHRELVLLAGKAPMNFASGGN